MKKDANNQPRDNENNRREKNAKNNKIKRKQRQKGARETEVIAKE